jgi:hypothetical protein
MDDILNTLRNWSEVWGLFFPLGVMLFSKLSFKGLELIKGYVLLAFIINSFSTIIFVFNNELPPIFRNNNIFYNIHSLIRVFCFSAYLLITIQEKYLRVARIIFFVYFILVIINFSFFELAFFFSTRVYVSESIILLIIVILFLLNKIHDDSNINWMKHPAFIICVGIGFYEVLNFFIFLFFSPLLKQNREFGKLTMTIHNFTYVIFCITLAIAFLSNNKFPNAPDNYKPKREF